MVIPWSCINWKVTARRRWAELPSRWAPVFPFLQQQGLEGPAREPLATGSTEEPLEMLRVYSPDVYF